MHRKQEVLIVLQETQYMIRMGEHLASMFDIGIDQFYLRHLSGDMPLAEIYQCYEVCRQYIVEHNRVLLVQFKFVYEHVEAEKLVLDAQKNL